jgi:phosphatidate cytidylyltransferase
VIASLIASAAVALHGYTAIEDIFKYFSYSVFASVYISLCMAHVVCIRFLPNAVRSG